MQSITRLCLGAQELNHALATFFGITVRHAHCVLRGIPVTKPRPPADLDKRRKTGEDHVDLALIERPGVDQRVHARVRGIDLQAAELILPETAELFKLLVHRRRAAIFFAHRGAALHAAFSEQEDEARAFARREGDLLHQRATMVAA
ncbi:hypothetical protein SDC9_152873 [bioreactor metagenome]|uniref:Uncharacterized protein n=1 Tax=bioreactor metagenome TaxID=1076179 RepID=A0A645EWL9_9ZZZZ